MTITSCMPLFSVYMPNMAFMDHTFTRANCQLSPKLGNFCAASTYIEMASERCKLVTPIAAGYFSAFWRDADKTKVKNFGSWKTDYCTWITRFPGWLFIPIYTVHSFVWRISNILSHSNHGLHISLDEWSFLFIFVWRISSTWLHSNHGFQVSPDNCWLAHCWHILC
jgi:hypothetical protein